MDGLLIDSEALYLKAMQAAARTVGREMTLEFCHSMVGVPRAECNEMIQELYGPAFDLVDFRSHYARHLSDFLAEGVPVKPGVVELLGFLHERGLPRAVASSAVRSAIESHLGRAGLLDRFSAYVGRDDVARPKPAPDLYLEAARRLGVAPENCIAFEDSSVGFAAAHAAGMRGFLVPDLLQPTDEARSRCVAVLPDLHQARSILQSALA